MSKPFASTADTAEQRSTLEELAEGVYAFTAQGDPNVGAVVGPDSVLCIDARATPAAAREWLEALREVTDKPVEHLVLSHYHAVRTLGASALGARHVIAHETTRRWIDQRGEQDRESELRRFPRLFRDAHEIPGLTVPDLAFADSAVILLGGREVHLRWLGGGHTPGDAVVWLPRERILFAGDLVERGAAPYAGDALIRAWATGTLDALLGLEPDVVVPGRGPAAGGADARDAVEATRAFLLALWDAVRPVHEAGGDLREAARAARAALEPGFGDLFLFEHCFPFGVARAYDEAGGAAPRVWTAERDAEVWARLQGEGG
jgi:glyoxylase-like metal-dependent hydrolase (beta-lactamase superfamily II)